MPGFARQAVVLSLSRIANYGLMIISPVILVRILSVGEFGRYREFLLYASLLQAIASFSIFDSLLYFIPRHPASVWRVLRETTGLTAIVSTLVIAGCFLADLLTHGALLGRYRLEVSLYILLYVNLDFWEPLWLATHRTSWVFFYSAGRLVGRMLVVVGVALLTKNVTIIIWSLLGFEGLRFAVSGIAWAILARARDEPPVENIRRAQLSFCMPVGVASVLYMISRNLGNLVVTKWIGAAALAQLTIGTYGDPIILALRNSVSTAILPELVRRRAQSADAPLLLWQRATLVNCILLFPASLLLAWFAEPLVLKVFGTGYRPAVPVLQIYALSIALASFDFSPPLRAINQTRPLVSSTLAAAVVSGLCLWLLLPIAGLAGAAITLAISNLTEVISRALSVARLYHVSLSRLLPWARSLKVAVCAVMAAIPLCALTWRLNLGLLGVMLASLLYAVMFAALLMASGVDEAVALARRIRSSIVVAASGGP